MQTRIYEVVDNEDDNYESRLIEAPNSAQALRHVAKRFTVSVASAKRVAELMNDEVKVEVAGQEPEQTLFEAPVKP